MCEMMKCQLLCSEKVTDLAKAMLKVQQALRPASKDSYNDFTRSKYATLASVMESCRDTLIQNGIWVTQFPVNIETPHTLGLVTKLVHIDSGQWQSSLLVMPLPKNDPQGFGSALTYARRYGLCALVGIVTEDDDANLASNNGVSTTVLNSQNQPKFQPVNPVYVDSVAPKSKSVHKSMKVAQTKNQSNNSNNHTIATRGLPKVDGVVFKQVKSADGKDFITATGNTRAKKAILKQAGFRWEPKQKVWWRSS